MEQMKNLLFNTPKPVSEVEKDKTIPIRFIIKEVNKNEYDELITHYGYYPLFRKKTLQGYKLGGKLLVKIADVGNWREQYVAEYGGFKCLNCQDTGVLHNDLGWNPCSCSFGELVRANYRNK